MLQPITHGAAVSATERQSCACLCLVFGVRGLRQGSGHVHASRDDPLARAPSFARSLRRESGDLVSLGCTAANRMPISGTFSPTRRGLLCLCLIWTKASAQPSELKLGILLPWEGAWNLGPYVSPAILRAVEAINARDDVLNNTQLKWVWDDGQCNGKVATGAFMQMELSYGVDAIIGPACDSEALRIVPVGAYFDMPVLSYAVEGVTFISPEINPNFARVVPTAADILPAYFPLAAAHNWDTIGVITTIDENFGGLGDYFISRLLPLQPSVRLGFVQAMQPTSPLNAGFGALEIISELKESETRVVLLLGACLDMRNLLLAAKRLGLSEGYQFILLNASPTCHIVEGAGWPLGWGPEANDEAAAAFNNTISMAPLPYVSAETEAFASQMATDFATQRFAPHRFPPAGDITPAAAVTQNPSGLPYVINATEEYDTTALDYAARLHDAITLYALAADAAISAGTDPRQQENIMSRLQSIFFVGLTGPVVLNSFLDRTSSALYQNVIYDSGGLLNLVSVATYDVFSASYTSLAQITYPGRVTTVPLASVPRSCLLSDYDYTTGDCNADGDVVVSFTVKEGIACNDDNTPEATAECAYVPVDNSFGQATLAFASIGTAVCLGFIAWLALERNHDICRQSQPLLGGMAMVGCLLLNISIFFTVGGEGNPACVVAPRIFHLSFLVAISAVIVKLYVCWQSNDTDEEKNFSISLRGIFNAAAGLIFLNVALLLVAAGVSPHRLEDETETADGAAVEIEQARCQNGGVFFFLIWGVDIALLLGTCFLAYGVRFLAADFREVKDILTSTYQVMLLTIVGVIVTYMADSEGLESLVRSLCVMVGTTGGLSLIFLPKMKAIYEGVEPEEALNGKPPDLPSIGDHKSMVSRSRLNTANDKITGSGSLRSGVRSSGSAGALSSQRATASKHSETRGTSSPRRSSAKVHSRSSLKSSQTHPELTN